MHIGVWWEGHEHQRSAEGEGGGRGMPPGGGGDLLQLEAAEARQRLELLGEVLLVLERVVEVDVVVVAQ